MVLSIRKCHSLATSSGTTRSAAEYGYKQGVILPSPGILRVTVSPVKSIVEFVQGGSKTAIADRYELIPY